jgi:hypothetical protein
LTLLRLTEVETLGMRTAYFAVLHRRFRDIVFQPNPGIPADCRMFSVYYYVINPSFLSVLFFLLLSGSSLSVFQVL